MKNQTSFGADMSETFLDDGENPFSPRVPSSPAENPPKLTRRAALLIAGAIVKGDFPAALALVEQALADNSDRNRGGYGYYLDHIAAMLRGDSAALRAAFINGAVQIKGNMKLPFAAYSEFPLVTCPGAGGVHFESAGFKAGTLGVAHADTPNKSGCASWCYSMSGLRNPSVVYRFLVTTLAATIEPEWCAETVLAICEQEGVPILRLFVDGDFRSDRHLAAWMIAIRNHPKVAVYGYTKSWEILARYRGEWPTNYRVNISSGSRHEGTALHRQVMSLPIVRGRFIAVDPWEQAWLFRSVKDGLKRSTAEHALEDWRREVDVLGKYAINAKSRYGLRSVEAKAASTAWVAKKGELERHLRSVDPEFCELADRLAKLHSKARVLGASYKEYVVGRESAKGQILPTKDVAVPFSSGQMAQAVYWALVVSRRLPGQQVCPISCAECPRQGYSVKRGLLAHALAGDWQAVEQEADIMEARRNADALARKERGEPAHWCFSLAGKDILIAIH